MRGISQIDTLEIIKKWYDAAEAAIALKNTLARLALQTELARIELRRFGITMVIRRTGLKSELRSKL